MDNNQIDTSKHQFSDWRLTAAEIMLRIALGIVFLICSIGFLGGHLVNLRGGALIRVCVLRQRVPTGN